MAYDKVVDSAQLDADLTSVASLIKEKAGLSDGIDWPQGFLDALGGIGSGGNNGYVCELSSMTPSEDITDASQMESLFKYPCKDDKWIALSLLFADLPAGNNTATNNGYVCAFSLRTNENFLDEICNRYYDDHYYFYNGSKHFAPQISKNNYTPKDTKAIVGRSSPYKMTYKAGVTYVRIDIYGDMIGG